MNLKKRSPIDRLNPHHKWQRFNSLPHEVQESIVYLLRIASGDGLEPIMAREKLNLLHSMTDEEIIEIHSVSHPCVIIFLPFLPSQ
jgi:hypothetical protein